jgi:hypothetical protein
MSLKRIALFVLIVLTGYLLPGCSDSFDPASLIARPRVLGARVEAGGDATRPWPRPGEAARVTWFVVTPGAPLPLSWDLAACVAAPAGTGRCRDGETPFATATGQNSDGALPVFDFVAPTADVLAGASQLLITGVIHAQDAPDTDVTLTVDLQLGDDQNHAPTLADDLVTLDGAPWAEPAPAAGIDVPAAGEACVAVASTLGLPTVAAKAPAPAAVVKHPIAVAIDAADRDWIPAQPPATPGREALLLSRFTTAGKLAEQFGVVEAEDQEPVTTLSVDWEPPPVAMVPADGLLVRFYFVARDQRGGIDWISRALCVTQP